MPKNIPDQHIRQPTTELRRVLRLRDLVLFGIVLIQPTAPMPLFGVVGNEARGHVVLTILIAMCAMMLTAVSYGRMARAYPAAGSAYTYVGRELHPELGYLTGWSMAMDYMLNPVICAIWCSKAAANVVSGVPYTVWALLFVTLFTLLNLRGIQASARTNTILAAGMGAVVVVFLGAAIRYLAGNAHITFAGLALPFYNPATFDLPAVLTGTSIAALTYIGFDGISTLSEEVENPERNVLRATVLTCLVTGVLAGVEVYAAQLVWPDYGTFNDPDMAFVEVAGRVAGPWLFHLVNFTLLVVSVGSGIGAQLGAARLLYGMGREDALPRSFFGALDAKTAVPRNNVLLLGAVALAGSLLLTYQLGAELLNFGAFCAFMGVNAAAMRRYYFSARERKIRDLVFPLLGFLICLYIWLNLRWPAKLAGGAWMLIGILYRAARARRSIRPAR
jgi:amino acid transporter